MNDIDFDIIKKLSKKLKIFNFDCNLACKLFIFYFYISIFRSGRSKFNIEFDIF